MCGITGFLSYQFRKQDVKKSRHYVLKMAEQLGHRGPDAFGEFCDKKSGVFLSHRRLAILDVSERGAQPMHSSDGRLVLVYNGEIYNFKYLARILKNAGHHFKGSSDSEVLLAAVQIWGLEKTLENIEGMFSFAIWDREEKLLTLVRDRVGEKPLYYGFQGETFLFGSELKALKVHPNWQNKVSRDAVASFVYHNYVPSPYSIYEGVHKLTPGHYIQISSDYKISKYPKLNVYWSLKKSIEKSNLNKDKLNDHSSINLIENKLKKSVKNMMNSDVPLGAFLSGGIDSSIVVSLMQDQSIKKIRTFTIGFSEKHYNEAVNAKKIANYLNTEHEELYVSSKVALDSIPNIQSMYDEPFSDSSQIPTYLLSKMTKKHVTVALSGDGGDELFGGYDRYQLAEKIWTKKNLIPSSGLKFIESIIQSNLFKTLNKIKKIDLGFRNPSDKLKRLSKMKEMKSIENLYSYMISHWSKPNNLVIGGQLLNTALTESDHWLGFNDNIHRLMYLDTISYLPDDILVKVDRAAMSVSLETRLPFLNHKVIESAWSLPLNKKIRSSKSKWVLKQILKKYIPENLTDKPKKGFAMPIDTWLRTDLRDWGESLLDNTLLTSQGYFNPKPIRKKWEEHCSGDKDWHHHLWDILMFQSWLKENN